MIECCRCRCDIDGKLTEAIECHTVKGEDLTEYSHDGNIWRFCKDCWDEIIVFLAAEGMLP